MTHFVLSDKGSWLSSFTLVIYALCFSIAYVELDTGTGALILFSAVQLTMIGWGIYKKEQLSVLQWTAFIGGSSRIYLFNVAVSSNTISIGSHTYDDQWYRLGYI